MASFRMIKQVFHNYPILSNSVVYGTLYITAEFCQQTILRKYKPSEIPPPYDYGAITRYGVLGVTIYSPVYYYWYRWLDGKFMGKSPKIIVQKMLLDQFICTPPMLSGFFILMSLMEGKKDIFEECKKKVIPSFQTSCLFWMPAQAVNFLLMPPSFRVVYVGLCAFAWVNIMCLIKRKPVKVPVEKKK